MSKEFKVGDKVRIKPDELSRFLTEYSNRRRDRVAVIESFSFVDDDYAYRANVIWQKRGNRGKEFREFVRMVYLKKYWEAVCA